MTAGVAHAVENPVLMFEPVEFIRSWYPVYRFRVSEARQLRTLGLLALVGESYEPGDPKRGTA